MPPAPPRHEPRNHGALLLFYMTNPNISSLVDALVDTALHFYDTQPPTYQLPTYSEVVFNYDEFDAVFDALFPEGTPPPVDGPSPEERLLISATTKIVARRLQARRSIQSSQVEYDERPKYA